MFLSKLRFAGLPRILVALGLTSTIILFASHSYQENQARESYLIEVDQVAVVPPTTRPKPGQAAVDLAIAMYGIQIPKSAMHPKFDSELADRGLTTRGAFMEKSEVTIGTAAFTSWALLGSTLAHELEIHCNQNFFLIYAFDLIGLDGTGEAERIAYAHELNHAKRFGLKKFDTNLIADTVAYYYPTDEDSHDHVHNHNHKSENKMSLRTWLARTLIGAERS